jgi:hypothetical protein
VVHRLKVQLIGGLGRNELHRLTLHRFGNGFGVTEVVLNRGEGTVRASTEHLGQASRRLR